jgi:hypothetical protein
MAWRGPSAASRRHPDRVSGPLRVGDGGHERSPPLVASGADISLSRGLCCSPATGFSQHPHSRGDRCHGPLGGGQAGYPDSTSLQGMLSSRPGGGHNPWYPQVSGSNGSSGSRHQRLADLVASPIGRILPPVCDAGESSTIFSPLGARARARQQLRNFISFCHQCLPRSGMGLSPTFPGSVPCSMTGVAKSSRWHHRQEALGDPVNAVHPLGKEQDR